MVYLTIYPRLNQDEAILSKTSSFRFSVDEEVEFPLHFSSKVIPHMDLVVYGWTWWTKG